MEEHHTLDMSKTKLKFKNMVVIVKKTIFEYFCTKMKSDTEQLRNKMYADILTRLFLFDKNLNIRDTEVMNNFKMCCIWYSAYRNIYFDEPLPFITGEDYDNSLCEILNLYRLSS